MIRILVISVLVLTLVGCEKDDPINLNAPNPDLQSRIDASKTSHLVDTIYAHAGNHPAFEKETDQYYLHLRYWSHPNASKLKVYRSDSILNPDQFEFYREIDITTEPVPSGIFNRVLMKEQPEAEDFLVRIAFEHEDTLFITQATRIRANEESKDTKNVRDIQVETTPKGRAYFSWVGAGTASGNNLIELQDPTGNTFCSVVTTDPNFLFHNLRNALIDFTPALFDPRLVHGEEYHVQIYMTDNSGWMRNFRSFSFTADSNRIVQID
ncbi:MAG: hypothetical protein Salg2KO_20980 [Salibacteraceae bacterium]